MEGSPDVARGSDLARFLLVIGLLLSMAAISLVYDTRSFVSRAVLARGMVVSLERLPSGKGSVLYPVVQYTGERGEKRTLRLQVALLAMASMPSVGETVDVLYDETNPVDARIASFWGLYYLSIIFGGVAALLFGWAVCVFVRAPRY